MTRSHSASLIPSSPGPHLIIAIDLGLPGLRERLPRTCVRTPLHLMWQGQIWVFPHWACGIGGLKPLTLACSFLSWLSRTEHITAAPVTTLGCSGPINTSPLIYLNRWVIRSSLITSERSACLPTSCSLSSVLQNLTLRLYEPQKELACNCVTAIFSLCKLCSRADSMSLVCLRARTRPRGRE